MSLAWMYKGFDNPELLGSVLLVLQVDGEDAGKRFFVSKLVLSRSEFFVSLLARWTSSSSELLVTVTDAAEAEAVELLMRLVHGKPFDDVDNPLLLANVYAKADEYMFDHAFLYDLDRRLLKCIQRFGSLVAPSAIFGFLTSSRSLTLKRPSASALRERLWAQYSDAYSEEAKAFVIASFANVPSVITSNFLRCEFRSLSYEAVACWINSDDLDAHSENCIMFLLASWLVSNPKCPPARKTELLSKVRRGFVSPAYLADDLQGDRCLLPSRRFSGDTHKSFEWVAERPSPSSTTEYYHPERKNDLVYINGVFFETTLMIGKQCVELGIDVNTHIMPRLYIKEGAGLLEAATIRVETKTSDGDDWVLVDISSKYSSCPNVKKWIVREFGPDGRLWIRLNIEFR